MKQFVSNKFAPNLRPVLQSPPMKQTAPAKYKYLLERELVRRCDANPRYSLRAMARALRLAPGALSQILSGKRVPSYKVAQKILTSLELTPAEQREFVESLAAVQRSRGLERLNPEFRVKTKANDTGKGEDVEQHKTALKKAAKLREFDKNMRSPKDLSLELFRVIGDWYHYAILSLTYVKGFDPNPNWIAARLAITPLEAKLAVDRLIELGLLKYKNGKLICWEDYFTTADKHITNSALKRHHKQILNKSLYSMENDPIEIRNHSSMTMAIDPAKIDEAKKMIEEFTHRLTEFLESGKRLQVYELNIGLFPLQIRSNT